jgi:predicted nucleotide-binding protein
MKPRIFLGSSAQQEKLLQALTRGLQDIADVDAWTTVFNPGVSTLSRLVELTREVDFAVFVFAQDDWTTKGASPEAASGQACSGVRSVSAGRSSSTRTVPSSPPTCSV